MYFFSVNVSKYTYTFYALCVEILDFYEKKKKTVQAERNSTRRAPEAGAESNWEWRDGGWRGDARCQSRASGLHVAGRAGRQDRHVSTCASGGSVQNTGGNEMDVGGRQKETI